jgi:acetyl-CoA carboxylase carboxyl transferase subunit alpha
MKGYNELKDLSTEEMLAQRYEKYLAMGHFKD